MNKIIGTLSAAASFGALSLTMTACGAGGTAAVSTAPAAPRKAPAASASARPAADVIMIDPDGRLYGHREMAAMATEMARTSGGDGLPVDFCAMSYQQGIDEGGKFPAGRQAFMDACEAGMKKAR
ncbi:MULTISPECIES: hypothetical protein [Thermomonosporaceae]|uniref:hypothetical protein n=1 Tax=Thermomonosporaceae TaxID=2012 RepID=UPI00255AA0CF|nr:MULTISPECIES: hypothetical protein [Thermomonosporaceae]MDL4771754.1 hypothetical protein [Actinomadura xylanilytica]